MFDLAPFETCEQDRRLRVNLICMREGTRGEFVRRDEPWWLEICGPTMSDGVTPCSWGIQANKQVWKFADRLADSWESDHRCGSVKDLDEAIHKAAGVVSVEEELTLQETQLRVMIAGDYSLSHREGLVMQGGRPMGDDELLEKMNKYVKELIEKDMLPISIDVVERVSHRTLPWLDLVWEVDKLLKAKKRPEPAADHRLRGEPRPKTLVNLVPEDQRQTNLLPHVIVISSTMVGINYRNDQVSLSDDEIWEHVMQSRDVMLSWTERYGVQVCLVIGGSHLAFPASSIVNADKSVEPGIRGTSVRNLLACLCYVAASTNLSFVWADREWCYMLKDPYAGKWFFDEDIDLKIGFEVLLSGALMALTTRKAYIGESVPKVISLDLLDTVLHEDKVEHRMDDWKTLPLGVNLGSFRSAVINLLGGCKCESGDLLSGDYVSWPYLAQKVMPTLSQGSELRMGMSDDEMQSVLEQNPWSANGINFWHPGRSPVRRSMPGAPHGCLVGPNFLTIVEPPQSQDEATQPSGQHPPVPKLPLTRVRLSAREEDQVSRFEGLSDRSEMSREAPTRTATGTTDGNGAQGQSGDADDNLVSSTVGTSGRTSGPPAKLTPRAKADRMRGWSSDSDGAGPSFPAPPALASEREYREALTLAQSIMSQVPDVPNVEGMAQSGELVELEPEPDDDDMGSAPENLVAAEAVSVAREQSVSTRAGSRVRLYRGDYMSGLREFQGLAIVTERAATSEETQRGQRKQLARLKYWDCMAQFVPNTSDDLDDELEIRDKCPYRLCDVENLRRLIDSKYSGESLSGVLAQEARMFKAWQRIDRMKVSEFMDTLMRGSQHSKFMAEKVHQCVKMCWFMAIHHSTRDPAWQIRENDKTVSVDYAMSWQEAYYLWKHLYNGALPLLNDGQFARFRNDHGPGGHNAGLNPNLVEQPWADPSNVFAEAFHIDLIGCHAWIQAMNTAAESNDPNDGEKRLFWVCDVMRDMCQRFDIHPSSGAIPKLIWYNRHPKFSGSGYYWDIFPEFWEPSLQMMEKALTYRRALPLLSLMYLNNVKHPKNPFYALTQRSGRHLFLVQGRISVKAVQNYADFGVRYSLNCDQHRWAAEQVCKPTMRARTTKLCCPLCALMETRGVKPACTIRTLFSGESFIWCDIPREHYIVAGDLVLQGGEIPMFAEFVFNATLCSRQAQRPAEGSTVRGKAEAIDRQWQLGMVSVVHWDIMQRWLQRGHPTVPKEYPMAWERFFKQSKKVYVDNLNPGSYGSFPDKEDIWTGFRDYRAMREPCARPVDQTSQSQMVYVAQEDYGLGNVKFTPHAAPMTNNMTTSDGAPSPDDQKYVLSGDGIPYPVYAKQSKEWQMEADKIGSGCIDSVRAAALHLRVLADGLRQQTIGPVVWGLDRYTYGYVMRDDHGYEPDQYVDYEDECASMWQAWEKVDAFMDCKAVHKEMRGKGGFNKIWLHRLLEGPWRQYRDQVGLPRDMVYKDNYHRAGDIVQFASVRMGFYMGRPAPDPDRPHSLHATKIEEQRRVFPKYMQRQDKMFENSIEPLLHTKRVAARQNFVTQYPKVATPVGSSAVGPGVPRYFQGCKTAGYKWDEHSGCMIICPYCNVYLVSSKIANESSAREQGVHLPMCQYQAYDPRCQTCTRHITCHAVSCYFKGCEVAQFLSGNGICDQEHLNALRHYLVRLSAVPSDDELSEWRKAEFRYIVPPGVGESDDPEALVHLHMQRTHSENATLFLSGVLGVMKSVFLRYSESEKFLYHEQRPKRSAALSGGESGKSGESGKKTPHNSPPREDEALTAGGLYRQEKGVARDEVDRLNGWFHGDDLTTAEQSDMMHGHDTHKFAVLMTSKAAMMKWAETNAATGMKLRDCEVRQWQPGGGSIEWTMSNNAMFLPFIRVQSGVFKVSDDGDFKLPEQWVLEPRFEYFGDQVSKSVAMLINIYRRHQEAEFRLCCGGRSIDDREKLTRITLRAFNGLDPERIITGLQSHAGDAPRPAKARDAAIYIAAGWIASELNEAMERANKYALQVRGMVRKVGMERDDKEIDLIQKDSAGEDVHVDWTTFMWSRIQMPADVGKHVVFCRKLDVRKFTDIDHVHHVEKRRGAAPHRRVSGSLKKSITGVSGVLPNKMFVAFQEDLIALCVEQSHGLPKDEAGRVLDSQGRLFPPYTMTVSEGTEEICELFRKFNLQGSATMSCELTEGPRPGTHKKVFFTALVKANISKLMDRAIEGTEHPEYCDECKTQLRDLIRLDRPRHMKIFDPAMWGELDQNAPSYEVSWAKKQWSIYSVDQHPSQVEEVAERRNRRVAHAEKVSFKIGPPLWPYEGYVKNVGTSTRDMTPPAMSLEEISQETDDENVQKFMQHLQETEKWIQSGDELYVDRLFSQFMSDVFKDMGEGGVADNMPYVWQGCPGGSLTIERCMNRLVSRALGMSDDSEDENYAKIDTEPWQPGPVHTLFRTLPDQLGEAKLVFAYLVNACWHDPDWDTRAWPLKISNHVMTLEAIIVAMSALLSRERKQKESDVRIDDWAEQQLTKNAASEFAATKAEASLSRVVEDMREHIRCLGVEWKEKYRVLALDMSTMLRNEYEMKCAQRNEYAHLLHAFLEVTTKYKLDIEGELSRAKATKDAAVRRQKELEMQNEELMEKVRVMEEELTRLRYK